MEDIRKILCITSVLLFSTIVSAATVADSWTRLYNETTQPPYNDDGAEHSDFGNDIALDSQGNIIVTGCWHSIFGGVAWSRWMACDFFVAKYDSSGNKIWLQKLDTGWNKDEKGLVVQVDRNDNIYVMGTSNGDIANTGKSVIYPTAFVAKYSAAGSLEWIDQYADQNTKATGMSTDRYGNSYVLGYVFDPVNRQDNVYVRKYYRTGGLGWHKVFDTPHQDRSNAITVDSRGYYVYFTSTTNDVETTGYFDWTDLVVTRLGNSGTMLWQKKYSTPSQDVATAIAVDATNRQLVLGGTSSGQILDFPFSSSVRDTFVGTLSIYDGRPKWTRKDFATEPGAVAIKDIAIENNGNIHIIGNYGKNGTREFGWGNVVHYTAYDVSGNFQGTRLMGTYGTRDIAGGVAVDGAGNFYITGGAKGDLNGVESDASITEADMFITKNIP